MSARRILLAGYYGKGNFGDDVLLQVSYRLLKQAMPDADISVLVDGDAGGYVPAMLGEVTVLKPARHGRFDLIVHGGGGVYFDFGEYGARHRQIEKIVERLGLSNYLAAEKLLRSIVSKSRTSTATRLGFGIGVGSYAPGSPRLRADAAILADYDALWVRDAQSIENLERFSSVVTDHVILGSDLAFLTSYWLKVPAARAAAPRPRLGIALRDWPEELGGLPDAMLAEIFAALAKEYDMTGFIFDSRADVRLQRLLAPYTSYVWRPGAMRIDDFAARLAQQDVLLTSRFHGAVCSACVGVPSVVVAIEPKLEQLKTMLPNACRIVAAHHTAQWLPALREALAITPHAIAMDVQANRAASAAALTAIERWLV
jgi:polysaccharide pyruvyl transferase WcaK-like protein